MRIAPGVHGPRFLTVREFADRVGVSPQTVRREIQAGRIQAVRPSPHGLRISEHEVVRVLEPASGEK